MGVKSTTRLTREDAEALYAEFKARDKIRKYRSKAVAMTDKELEDEIERLNDKYLDGGFDNYLITTHTETW